MQDPGKNWGDATDWAGSIGSGDHSPAVGAIAWWSYGHVAYVEQVSGDKVFIRADNFSQTAGYTSNGWIPASSVGLFLHPFDVGTRIGVRLTSGAFLVKEGGLGAPWVTEYSGNVTQGVLSGNRIGVRLTNGAFLVKEGGLGAPWVTEYSGNVNEGALSLQ